MTRTVFFISDGTGITAETLGRSLLTQFEMIPFEYITLPNINSLTKAQDALSRIEQAYTHTGERPLIFATLIDPQISQYLQQSPAIILDFFQTFINPLEQELKQQSSHKVGRSHGVKDYTNYMLRINAVNFALANDDGGSTKEYGNADVILLGVSRCGKTPTCLYLALQFGIFAANYPLTDEDLEHGHLPKTLQSHRDKLFGLTIDPLRLQKIRQERRASGSYASLECCESEIAQVSALYKREQIPFLDTTARSIEEIATEILAIRGVKRRLY